MSDASPGRDSTAAYKALRFRKKPVEIEAVQWTGENVEQVMAFVFADDRWKRGIESEYVAGPGIGHVPALGTLDIPTLEGTMTAQAGDWLIRGVQGELYPCKPDIFEATYDAVPCGACAGQGWTGNRQTGPGMRHYHCPCGRPCKACPDA